MNMQFERRIYLSDIYVGALMMDASNQANVFVLRDTHGFWFRDCELNAVQREPADFWFSPALVCARGFESRPLCESFQTFLKGHGFDTDICEVNQARLLTITQRRGRL